MLTNQCQHSNQWQHSILTSCCWLTCQSRIGCNVAVHWQQWAPALTHKEIHVLPEASQQESKKDSVIITVWWLCRTVSCNLLLMFQTHALHMAVLCMEWFMANLLVCELLKAFVRTDYVSTKASVDEPSLLGLQCAVTAGHIVLVMWLWIYAAFA